jgi:hypothetical protein
MSPQEFIEFMRRNPQVSIGPHGDQAEDLLQPDPIRPVYTMTSNKVPTEHEEQVALFAWAEASGITELAWMFAVPNGGYRHPATAAHLKAEGVKAGAPDIILPIPRWCYPHDSMYHGMFLELKRADHSNKTTPEQDAWLAELNALDYYAVVAYGCEEAIDHILCYLDGEAPLGWDMEP